MNFFNKNERKHLKRKDWKITDTVVKIEDIVTNHVPDFSEKYNLTEPFVCIRNFHLSCVYIKQSQMEKFKTLASIYDEKSQLINLTNIIPYTISEDCYAQVANRTSPAEVSIKELHVCRVDDIDIYVTRVIKLNHSDQLFRDLINLQTFKDKYNFK